ncbi:hypothetical protein SALBM217S_08372 [Streptomyces griseoloalbus]
MHPPPRRRGGVRRLLAVAVTALALPLTMLSTGTTPARAAAVQCSVDYKTNDWGSGFTADLTVTNRGSDVIDGWTLTYAYSGNQRLVNGWNGSWSQSGSTVTVRNAGHNGRIAAGAAVTAGAQFSYSGTNTAPTSFSVNGTACVGAHQPPIAVLTSPEAGSVYTQGETVPLAATAAAADQATVTKVEFYDDTELLGTDTSAPFTLSVGGLAVGAHSLVAKAYDSLGASASSTPVGITVASGPAVVASPSQLGVRQGESGTFEVKLSKQPSANVTVTTARASGNTGLSVSSGASLTFTPSNWSTAQRVTVAADSSGTGSAVFESDGRRPRQGRGDRHPAGRGQDVREPLPGALRQDHRPGERVLLPEGIPYHSVETLIVEAPDHGHETTSEAYSYLLWLQAMYGRITGDWTRFNDAWATMERYAIPTHAAPTTSFYEPRHRLQPRRARPGVRPHRHRRRLPLAGVDQELDPPAGFGRLGRLGSHRRGQHRLRLRRPGPGVRGGRHIHQRLGPGQRRGDALRRPGRELAEDGAAVQAGRQHALAGAWANGWRSTRTTTTCCTWARPAATASGGRRTQASPGPR